MGKVIVFLALGVVIAVVVARTAIRKRRDKAAPTELNKHPERLEQSLDPTDDA
jgi:hypothetical protein